MAKEAKYEHGLKKTDFDYDEILGAIRDNNNAMRNDRTPGISLFYITKKGGLIFFI